MKAATSTRRLVLLLALATLAVGLDAPMARAVVAPQLPHSSWTKTGGGEAMEVRATYRIVKEPVATWWQKDPNVYWASQFFPARYASGGYFGL